MSHVSVSLPEFEALPNLAAWPFAEFPKGAHVLLLFSSHEPKSQVSFTDPTLSVRRRSLGVRLYCFVRGTNLLSVIPYIFRTRIGSGSYFPIAVPVKSPASA